MMMATETFKQNKPMQASDLLNAQLERMAAARVHEYCPVHGCYTWSRLKNTSNPGCPKCAAEAEEKLRARAAFLSRMQRLEREADAILGSYSTPYDAKQTFETFSVDDSNRNQKVAVMAARKFAEGLMARLMSGNKEKSKNGLLLIGSFGTGKTHLANAIVNEVRKSGLAPVFLTAPTFFNFFRPGSSVSANAATKALGSVPLLIVDELGRTTGSEFERTQLQEVLDARSQRGFPTVLISNLNMEGLMDFVGAAIASRVPMLFCPVVCAWGDYRKKKSLRGMTIDECFDVNVAD